MERDKEREKRILDAEELLFAERAESAQTKGAAEEAQEKLEATKLEAQAATRKARAKKAKAETAAQIALEAQVRLAAAKAISDAEAEITKQRLAEERAAIEEREAQAKEVEREVERKQAAVADSIEEQENLLRLTERARFETVMENAKLNNTKAAIEAITAAKAEKEAITAAKAEKEARDDSSTARTGCCALCTLAPPVFMFVPCNHVCLCLACAPTYLDDLKKFEQPEKCPICNCSEITGIVHVYY